MEPDKKTYAQRRRETRKLELRELLRGQEYIDQLHRWFDADLTADQLQVAKFKADIALRLLAKCLPDQKAVEISGDINHNYVARTPLIAESTEQWQEQHSPATIQ